MSPPQFPVEQISESDVAAHLSSGGLLLTATPALAADWKRRYISGLTHPVINTPCIYNWQHWLAALARADESIPVAYNNMQELHLWQRLIQSDLHCNTATATGLARHAMAAYALMQEYKVKPDALAGGGEEAEAFAGWIAAMHQELKASGRTLSADLPALLLAHAAAFANQKTILLNGFALFTPMQQQIITALQAGGAELRSVAAPAASAQMQLTACPDTDAEYEMLAESLVSLISVQPDRRIAIVCSSQVNDEERLRRVLNRQLLPANYDELQQQAVNMSGPPLGKTPMVSQLLHVLHLAGKSGAAFADFSQLLFSPGVKGYDDERELRAGLDARFREQKRHYISFKSLLASEEMQAMPELAAVLKSLLLWKTAALPASEWVRAVHGLLQATGFLQAESAERSAAEIRQLNTLRECLASLVALDAVSGPLAWQAFLSQLQSTCNETRLQIPVHQAGINVIALHEIAGLRFDAVFAIGFDEDALPLPAKPVPFMPLALQRKMGLPLATAESAFACSEFLTAELKRAAPVLHISYARRRDERDYHVSPLFSALPESPYELVTGPDHSIAMENYADSVDLPLAASARVRGGASIIKHQSACPFRAFATHRLAIKSLEEPEPGIDAADKGSLIHLALEFIWSRLKSQQALLAMKDEQMALLIDEAIQAAWSEAGVSVAETVCRIEEQRMRSLLHAWLEMEKQRPVFEVDSCEKSYDLQLPETGAVRFPVWLKADRIDYDAEGHKILIDYKTGQKQSAGKWLEERMAEPQLPLYSMAEQLGEKDAVCFARVRSGDMGFEGLSGEKIGIGGITPYNGKDEAAESWPELLAVWRQRINALASEFVAGRSDVSPRDYHACDYCGLEAVCRIDELDRTGDDES